MVSKLKNITDHQDFIKSVASARRPNKRRFLLALATPKQIKVLQEITHNVVRKNVPLTQCQIKSLVRGRYRKPILEAGKRQGSIESKRKIFIQKGGFLQYILPAALGYLAKYL